MTVYYFGTVNRQMTKWLREAGARDVLYSFAYASKCYEPEELVEMGFEHVMLDSGAFTVAKSGKSIDLTDYCEYIEQHGQFLSQYVMLDVIGYARVTAQRNMGRSALASTQDKWRREFENKGNFDFMVNRGLKPLAVWQYNTSEELLRHFAKHTDKFGIGSGLGEKMMKRAWSLLPPEKNFWHGFAQTAMDSKLKRYSSVDSTTWYHAYKTTGRPYVTYSKRKRAAHLTGLNRRWETAAFLKYGRGNEFIDQPKAGVNNVHRRAVMVIMEMLRQLRQARVITY